MPCILGTRKQPWVPARGPQLFATCISHLFQVPEPETRPRKHCWDRRLIWKEMFGLYWYFKRMFIGIENTTGWSHCHWLQQGGEYCLTAPSDCCSGVFQIKRVVLQSQIFSTMLMDGEFCFQRHQQKELYKISGWELKLIYYLSRDTLNKLGLFCCHQLSERQAISIRVSFNATALLLEKAQLKHLIFGKKVGCQGWILLAGAVCSSVGN